MRILPIALILLLTGGVRLMAQVDFEIQLEQEQFLRDEPVLVKVRITNRSGQTLRLGEGNDWIQFGVDAMGGGPVERTGTVVTPSPFELESAHVATREINLQPGFDISQTGRYSVSATLRIRQWDRDLAAKSKAFEVVRGARLWEQEVGVPGATGVPEVRRYVLQQANYRKQLKLYVRVSNDADTYAHQVVSLGTLVSFGRPEAQVDEQSNLHVLFQTGARSFQYVSITPSGVLTLRQSYDFGARRPTLRAGESGRIGVFGGVRRMAASDLPPTPAVEGETNAAPASIRPAPAAAPSSAGRSPADKDVQPTRK